MDLIKHMDLSSAGQTVLLLFMCRSRQTKGSIFKARRTEGNGCRIPGRGDTGYGFAFRDVGADRGSVSLRFLRWRFWWEPTKLFAIGDVSECLFISHFCKWRVFPSFFFFV